MKLFYVVFFFTTNSPVIFPKYIFDFVLHTASSALSGVCRRKVHGKGIKTKTLHQTYVIILSRDLKQRRRRRRRKRERLKSNSLKPGSHIAAGIAWGTSRTNENMRRRQLEPSQSFTVDSSSTSQACRR